MNAKQTTPIAAALAPLAIVAPELLAIAAVGCGLYFGLKWLLFDDEEKKLESVPANAKTKIRRKEAEAPAFLHIPAEIVVKHATAPPQIPAGKSNLTPAASAHNPTSVTISPNSAPAAPKIPLSAQKKIISREDMAKIFNGGRGLTRKTAVSALKALGFGKTAAYTALTPDGRFSAWLRFAPDGIITWTE